MGNSERARDNASRPLTCDGAIEEQGPWRRAGGCGSASGKEAMALDVACERDGPAGRSMESEKDSGTGLRHGERRARPLDCTQAADIGRISGSGRKQIPIARDRRRSSQKAASVQDAGEAEQRNADEDQIGKDEARPVHAAVKAVLLPKQAGRRSRFSRAIRLPGLPAKRTGRGNSQKSMQEYQTRL